MATQSRRTTPKGQQGRKPNSRVTSAKDWKSSARHPVELELPSGNICLALNKGMRVFVRDGKIPNSLMPIVEAALASGDNRPPSKRLAEAAGDESMLADMLTLVDNVVLSCVVEPVIMQVPVDDDGDPDESQKDPELLYVDDVDMEDKMFIFYWSVGGTSDLEQFRKEFAESMAGVQQG